VTALRMFSPLPFCVQCKTNDMQKYPGNSDDVRQVTTSINEQVKSVSWREWFGGWLLPTARQPDRLKTHAFVIAQWLHRHGNNNYSIMTKFYHVYKTSAVIYYIGQKFAYWPRLIFAFLCMKLTIKQTLNSAHLSHKLLFLSQCCFHTSATTI